MCPGSSSWGSPCGQSSRACLCPFPGHVSDHSAGEPTHHPGHQDGPSPPHPMHFFLSHLALMDITFSSVTVPKMLMYLQMQDQTIPYAGCIDRPIVFHVFWLHW